MHATQLLSVGTAVPKHRIEQQDVRAFAGALFQNNFRNVNRLLPIFENTQIQGRNLGQPLDWYGEPHTFTDANALYTTVAPEHFCNAQTF